ncbi:MAG: hypothetical protein ACXVPY_09110, partial [Bacteroidia bacterium]
MKTIIKYILFFAWTISSCKVSFAQNENLDSLKLLLKTTKADTLKIRLVAEIGEAENIVRIGYWDSIANSAQKLNVLATKAF